MGQKLAGLSGIYRQLPGFQKQHVRLKSIFLKDGERAPREPSFSDAGTRVSGKRVKRGIIYPLILSPRVSHSLRTTAWKLDILGCVIFWHFNLYPAVSSNSKIKVLGSQFLSCNPS